jgi:hypothetical protein
MYKTRQHDKYIPKALAIVNITIYAEPNTMPNADTCALPVIMPNIHAIYVHA